MYVPAILERTSEGVHRYAIQDAMLQRREIECLGEITPEAVNGLILQLRYLQQPKSPCTSTAPAARSPAAWPSTT